MTVEITEHTADLAIDATGDDVGEAMSEAAIGLARIVTGRDEQPRPDKELRFALDAPDLPALVVAFLSELLWLLESDEMLWLAGGVDVRQDGDGWHLQARGNGIQYDPARHGQGTEVKAVTYHDLVVAQEGPRWRCRVVVDI